MLGFAPVSAGAVSQGSTLTIHSISLLMQGSAAVSASPGILAAVAALFGAASVSDFGFPVRAANVSISFDGLSSADGSPTYFIAPATAFIAQSGGDVIPTIGLSALIQAQSAAGMTPVLVHGDVVAAGGTTDVTVVDPTRYVATNVDFNSDSSSVMTLLFVPWAPADDTISELRTVDVPEHIRIANILFVDRTVEIENALRVAYAKKADRSTTI